MRSRTYLASGHAFETEARTAQVGSHRMVLATAASHDPVHDVTTSQSLVTLDAVPVLGKTLRVEGRSCDAVLDFGPGLGAGQLVLHWALMPQNGGMIVSGHGAWNEEPLTAFAEPLLADKAGRLHLANPDAFKTLTLDSGAPVPGPTDHAIAAAVADFGARVSSHNGAPTGCVAGCGSHGGVCACATGAGHDPTETITPARLTACVVLDSTCLAECAAQVDRERWQEPTCSEEQPETGISSRISRASAFPAGAARARG